MMSQSEIDQIVSKVKEIEAEQRDSFLFVFKYTLNICKEGEKIKAKILKKGLPDAVFLNPDFIKPNASPQETIYGVNIHFFEKLKGTKTFLLFIWKDELITSAKEEEIDKDDYPPYYRGSTLGMRQIMVQPPENIIQ